MGEEVVIFTCYDGAWHRKDDGGYTYEDNKTTAISVNANCKLEELENEVYEAIEVNRHEFQLTLKWSLSHAVRGLQPIHLRRDKDVKTFLAYIKCKSPEQSPLYVEVLPRVPQFGNATPFFGSDSGSNQVSVGLPTAPSDVLPQCGTNNAEFVPPSLPKQPYDTQIDDGSIREGHRPWTSHDVHAGVDVGGDDERVLPSNSEYDRLHDFDLNGYDYEGDCQHVELNQHEYDDQGDREDIELRQHDIVQDELHVHFEAPTHPGIPHEFQSVQGPNNHTQPSNSTTNSRCITESNTSDPIAPSELYMSKKELQLKLSDYALRSNFEYKVKKSTPDRYEVGCVDSNCKWRLRATKIKGCDMFMVRTFENTHSCNLDFLHRDHRQASSRVIGECVKSKFAGVARQYKPADIRQDIQLEYEVNISYEKAWRAKECALQSLWGSPEESFALLPSYCHVLETKNPGSVTRISTDGNNCFLYCFVAVGACIRGFLSSMRPVVAVDATTLKNRYRGCMYIASCMDGNGQIYPIAFGIGPGETDEAYKWFFERLKEVIGESADLVFISDRHKSIQKALTTVYPNVHHGLCTFHMGQNLKAKNFGKKDFIMASFFKAAKAYTLQEFYYYMQQLEGHNPRAAQYIRETDPARWARCFFPVRRYSIMTTNIAESINSVLREARCKPIVPLVEHIRELLQKWHYERRTAADRMTGRVSPWLEKELKQRHDASIRLHVVAVNLDEFRVIGSPLDSVVNLQAKTCTCREFDLDQYPCVHALAACRERNISYYSMCSRYYTVETLKDAYAESIYPVGDRKQWDIPPETHARIVLPPDMASRPAGRPKKLRIPSAGEERSLRRCGRCKAIGHNRQTCRNPIPLHGSSSSGRCYIDKSKNAP